MVHLRPCLQGTVPAMLREYISGHVYRVQLRLCLQGTAQIMFTGSSSGHVYRVQLMPCLQGTAQAMFTGYSSGHVYRVLLRPCLQGTVHSEHTQNQREIDSNKVLNWNGSLTHWGRVTHICVSKLTLNGSDNGLSPDWCHAIIWTNAEILLIGHLGRNFSMEIHTFSFKKMHLKMSSGKCRPFCLGLNGLKSKQKYLHLLYQGWF